MIRTFVAALLVAVGVGGNSPAPIPIQQSAGEVPKRVLGVLWNDTGLTKPRLVRLDSLTLEPVGHRVPLRLGGGSASAISPNGRLLAIGTGSPGIQLIDLKRMKEVAFVQLGGTGWVTYLFWEHGLLYAVVDGDRHAALAVVDPAGGHVLRRDPLAGMVLGAEVGSNSGTGQVVVLTAPRRHIGGVTITVAGRKGDDSAVVAGISGGASAENDANGYRARQVTPALAVDPDGHRALIVSASRTVATVSLDNLAVEYHTLSEPVSLLGRLHNWLEPRADAKVLEGPQRKAARLGSGLVAVTGADYAIVEDEQGNPTVQVEAAGLSLLDTSDWSIRKLDDETSDFSMFDSTLLAYGDTSWGDPSKKGIGLTGYDLAGREIFHVLGRRKVVMVEPSGDLAYVFVNERRRIVMDSVSGRVLGRPRTRTALSLVPA
jgi:hypothetical protein